MTTNLIITKKRGWPWFAFWGGVLIASLILMFFLGRMDGKEDRTALTFERNTLSQLVEEYEQRIIELEQQNIMLESSAQVDAQASERIFESISQLQTHIDGLETELSFYRGIMAPEKDVKGLHIADFTIERLASENQYSYMIALTQVKVHDLFLKGNVTATVEGLLNGKPTQYAMSELSDTASKDLQFTFKYFQHLNGRLTLPQGFVPEKISVTAKTSGRNSQVAEKLFQWSI